MKKTVLLLFVLCGLCIQVSGQYVEQIDAMINENTTRAHLEYLASDALRGRDIGEPGGQAAAAYIASQFRRGGLAEFDSSYFQSVPFVRFTPPKEATMMIGSDTLTYGEDFIVINGKQQNMTAPTVYVGHGQPADIADKDLRFAIVVSIAGDGVSDNPRDWIIASRAKRKLLKEAGAAGLIEIYQSTNLPWQFLKRMGGRSQLSIDQSEEQTDLSTFWVGTTQNEIINALKVDGTAITLSMEGVVRERFTSDNVVAYIEGTDPDLKDEYIVYSAHYDHVGIGRPDENGDTIYNGARDNAVGVTGVLSLVEYFSKHPPSRSSVFVLFTAEEKGLLGSKYFTEHLPIAAEKIKYNYNIDNGGYNDTTIISVIGLTRTTAEQEIQSSCGAYGLIAIEDPAKEQGLFDRSDNVNFAKLGIPAPTFSLGFRAFDEEIFKYYHRPADEVGSLNMSYVTKYVKSYILSAQKIANRVEAPFWLEGDKYYEKGVELYQKE